MTTPTQNDIPSSTAVDVRYNAEKLDEIINSDNDTYADRFGNNRFTVKGVVTYIQNVLLALAGKTGDASIGTPDTIAEVKTLSVASNSMLRVKGFLSAYDGGHGTWYFDGSDQSANVALYPNIFIAPTSSPTGSNGCWRLQIQDSIPAISFGVGISKDPDFNKTVIEQLVKWNNQYRWIVLPAKTIPVTSLSFTVNPNLIGTFGAIAGTTGGTGTVLQFSTYQADGTTVITDPCIRIAGTSTSRITGLGLHYIQILGKEGMASPGSFTTRTNRLGLDLNYIGGQIDSHYLFIGGFTQGLSLNEVWDGSFYSTRVRFCGSPDGTTPAVWMGSKATDNCNALRFYSFHIESSPFAVQIDFVRHTEFYGGKFECLRQQDATHNIIKINNSSQEVTFDGCMFVTTATTLTHYMEDQGQNTTLNKCNFDATAISASVKYPGIRWYKGVLNSTNRSNRLKDCKFTRILPSDGLTGIDDYPIILADGDRFSGSIFVDNTVTSSTGSTTIVNSGLIAAGNVVKVDEVYVSGNTNTKANGPIVYFNGSGAIVDAINLKPGNPGYAPAGGNTASWYNNTVINYNAKWSSNSSSTPNVIGKELLLMNAATTITSMTGTVGQEITLVSNVAGSVITYNASSMITSTGASITMTAKKAYKFVCYASGLWTQIGS